MNCLRNAGRLPASVYRECTMYSTLSPCPMCSGAIVLYKIPNVVVGENKTFLGAEDYMRSNGIIVEVVKTRNPLELINPAAPVEYGRAEDNTVRDPIDRKVTGLKLFSIEF